MKPGFKKKFEKLELTNQQRYQLINELKRTFKIQTLCQTIGLARSDYYYRKNKENQVNYQERQLLKNIEKIVEEFPAYGYRRISKELARRNIVCNHKKVLRLTNQNGWVVERKRKRIWLTNSNHQLRTYPNIIRDILINHPDQVWQADITYVRLNYGFVYLAAIIDCFTKRIKGWALSQRLETDFCVQSLKQAIKSIRGKSELSRLIHHSDQGVQYASNNYVKVLKENQIQISMSNKGAPQENSFVESFFATLKKEEVYLKEYLDFKDVQSNIKEFIEKVYDKKRIHSSIDYLTPAEFEKGYQFKNKLNHHSIPLLSNPVLDY